MPGRHRPLQRTGLIVTAAAVAVVVVAGGSWAGYREWSSSGCAATVQLKVAAAAEIAPAVRAAADAWSKRDDACTRVDPGDTDTLTRAGGGCVEGSTATPAAAPR